jgi:hypothetical protein
MDISPSQALPGFYDSFNRRFSIDNPIILIALTIIIILYYVVFKYLGAAGVEIPDSPVQESAGIKMIEILMWAFFIFLILVNGLQYFFSLDIKTTIKNIFSPVPEVDIRVTDISSQQQIPVPEIMIEKQVFNVPDNNYTYEEAKALCGAYGADLANYDQIEEAYKRGAEWCNYGWSDNQMIFYPTQKDTYDSLQNIDGHHNDCGRPGINGGFMKNRGARFGVNCYGNKPEITSEESDTLGNSPAYPLTLKELIFNDRVARFRNVLPEILISPFNSNKWSQI